MDASNFAEQWDDFVGGLIDRRFHNIENVTAMGSCVRTGYHYLHFDEGIVIYSNVRNHVEADRNSYIVREWPLEKLDWDELDKLMA
jgi:hypothetical protein